MAQIAEQTIVIRISKLIKNGEKFELDITEDMKNVIEAMVGEVVPEKGLIIEAELIA